MGSLEEIYQGIEYKNIDIALINNVNTKLALTIGQGIVQKEIPEIFDDIKKKISIIFILSLIIKKNLLYYAVVQAEWEQRINLKK